MGELVDLFQLGVNELAKAVVYFLPIFLLMGLVSAGSSLFVSRGSRQDYFLRFLFFSALGTTVGFLTDISPGDTLKALLPSVVVILTFLFQLVGRMLPDKQAPLSEENVLFSAFLCAVFFLVGYHYFQNFAA